MHKSELLIISSDMLFPDENELSIQPLTEKCFILSGVCLSLEEYLGEKAFRIEMPSSHWQNPEKEILTDRDYMAWLPIDFHNGTIEIDLASILAEGAPAYARGFAGISFRISDKNHFENIYLRPTNSQSDDQVRRNHSIQYFSYPEYRFEKLRKEYPEKYESYADIDLNRWIHMKIVVSGQKATLYLDHKHSPSLIVNDLKLGPDACGGVGVWIESGSIGWFKNVTITGEDEIF